MNQPILGLDFGNVIKNTQTGQLIEGVVESLTLLKQKFQGHMYIISRSGDECLNDDYKYQEYQKRVSLFLYQSGIDNIIHWSNVYFCKKRNEKALIADYIGITHFVDDRTEVLHHMTTVPNKYALNPTSDQLRDFPPNGMTVVSSWKEIVDLIQLP